MANSVLLKELSNSIQDSTSEEFSNYVGDVNRNSYDNLTNLKTELDTNAVVAKKFSADYCKRLSKCRVCKKTMEREELRIGKSVTFRGKPIRHYFHPTCAFNSFKKAQLEENVIKCTKDISEFDLLLNSDKTKILNRVDESNAFRSETRSTPRMRIKKTIAVQDSPVARRKRLKSPLQPSIKIMYTNADQ